MTAFTVGDRVRHIGGSLGTVLKVFPDEKIALVSWDEESGPGRRIHGKKSHVFEATIKKI